MIEDIRKDATTRMQKSVDALRHELKRLRTGRAHTSLLDHIRVDYYGAQMPLSQCANVTVAHPHTLTVAPWDKSMVQPIEKAIIASDLGLNPVSAGTVIRVPLPPLTEDRRRELIKVVKHEAEHARVAVRNVRRDVMRHLEELVRNGDVGDDDERAAESRVQKLTDDHVHKIDDLLKHKEAEIMEV